DRCAGDRNSPSLGAHVVLYFYATRAMNASSQTHLRIARALQTWCPASLVCQGSRPRDARTSSVVVVWGKGTGWCFRMTVGLQLFVCLMKVAEYRHPSHLHAR